MPKVQSSLLIFLLLGSMCTASQARVSAADNTSITPQSSAIGFQSGSGQSATVPSPPQKVLELEIISPKGNTDFRSYLAELQRRIQHSWSAPENATGFPTVIFKIHHYGMLSNLQFTKKGESPATDDCALRAVINASPFLRLPESSGDYIVIRCCFGGHISSADVSKLSANSEGVNIENDLVWNLPNPSYGYLNEGGNVVIAPQFAQAEPFQHGFAQVFSYTGDRQDLRKMIFIDKEGNHSVQPSQGYTWQYSNTKAYDELQIDGKTTLRDNYSSILSTRGRYKLVKRPYDYCVCDKSLSILKIFPLEWLKSTLWLNPKTGNYWCKVHSQAYEFTGADDESPIPGFEPVSTPTEFDKQYAYFDGFSEGLAAVMDEKKHWSFIDADGKVKIKLPPDCSNAQEFSEGLAAISIGGEPWKTAQNGVAQISPNEGAHFGYINTSGRFVIPPEYPCPKFIAHQEVSFKNGLAKVTGIRNSDITFGVINRKGKFVIPPIYVTLSPFVDGLTIVDAGPVGFDPKAWAGQKFYAGPEDRREQQFLKLLRQYDIIGMSRSRVEGLLGVGEKVHGGKRAASYVIEQSLNLEIRYDQDKVYGYALTGDFDRKRLWMKKNLKPRISQTLSDLFKENANSLVE